MNINNIKFKEISSYKAIKEIYSHKKAWSFLLDFIDGSDEIDFDDDGNLIFICYNGESMDSNYFTNDDVYYWIGGYYEHKLVFLQLMKRWSENHLELVIAQKKKTSDVEDLFGSVVKYIKETYNIKYLSTYPMNEKLKEYYKSKGFYDWKNELRLDL